MTKSKSVKKIKTWYLKLKTSHKVMLFLGGLFIVITGTAMCATC
jgi:hypothetical protein